MDWRQIYVSFITFQYYQFKIHTSEITKLTKFNIFLPIRVIFMNLKKKKFIVFSRDEKMTNLFWKIN